MTSFIPSMPKLSGMQAGDTINYKGSDYTVDSVGTYHNDDGGRGYRTVTITVALVSVTFTVSVKDTICSSYHITAAGNQYAVWSQSVEA